MIGAADVVFFSSSLSSMLVEIHDKGTQGLTLSAYLVLYLFSGFYPHQVREQRARCSFSSKILPTQFRRIARFQSRWLGAHSCTTTALHADSTRGTELVRDALYVRYVCMCKKRWIYSWEIFKRGRLVYGPKCVSTGNETCGNP